MNINLNNLNNETSSQNEAEVNSILSSLVTSRESKCINTEPIEKLICSENLKTRTFTAQAIAELAKTDINRELFTNEKVLSLLVKLFHDEDEELTVQTCRAIANITFENQKAQSLLGTDGLNEIISVLKSSSNNVKLRRVLCGCLLNVVMNSDELQKEEIRKNLLRIIENICEQQFEDFEEFEDAFYYLLSIINILAEHLDENTTLSDNLLKILVGILKVSLNFAISSICLDIIQGQLANNDVKLFLAKQGICELVFQLIEQYKSQIDDEDSRLLLKSACDLIVLILTGDESMEYLYDKGNGKLYQNMLLWLDSDDIDLKSTGILAIGNFARNDSHCIQMTQNKTAKKLLEVLSENNCTNGDIKLKHALLSTLRNLVIPAQNKAQILNDGLIEILYPLLQVNHETVIFKLLGTIRMVIDGQEEAALNLATRPEFIKKLVEYCFNSDHIGVRGEATRLLAWLIKHCHSSKPFPLILETKDCIRSVVEMISSNFAVMQNEALYALNLICFVYFTKDKEEEYECNSSTNKNINRNEDDFNREKGEEKLCQALKEADVGKHLTFVLNKYREKMDKETIGNVVTFLEQVTKSGELVQHLKDSGVHEALAKIREQKNAEASAGKITALINVIENV
ncbi:rap1 GTPase-GDP dissociation stimulator 1 [Agrilus planipennis]|uniref:Rap1 GTPase-GDP dissociation stimulator 1 n=1 Tax=Agrilus planipennis TaxID=224129 RepID=A0A1W4XSG1_AGRPL|nr:rap1 GTPase-GDP dissociation stimulator 1 [Agrilus planipennis]